MKTTIVSILVGLALASVVAGTLFAQGTAKTESVTNSRLDKIIQQNEQLLRQQAELKRLLEDVARDIQIIKRRTN